MDWQERMNRALKWIEQHLTEDIIWADAAREASCSPFHFLRMFEVITGVTAGEYVRRRRLSLAAMELLAHERKIIDVAIRYGYESPDAFTRAFRTLLGCTPSEARTPGMRLRSFPPIAFSITLTGGQAMDYRIETHSALHLTGVFFRTTTQEGRNLQEIPLFWDRCSHDGTVDRLARLVRDGSPIDVAGISSEFDITTGEFTYGIAIETPLQQDLLPPNCRDILVPATTWGIFEAHGPLPRAMQGLMRRIYREWFPSSGWEHADGPELEIYAKGDMHADEYTSEIWIPLQKPKP